MSVINPDYNDLAAAIREIDENKTIIVTTYEDTYITTRQMIESQNDSIFQCLLWQGYWIIYRIYFSIIKCLIILKFIL